MKQTIIFEEVSCETLDAEDATIINAVIPAIPTAIHLAEDPPELTTVDSSCSGGQFSADDIMSFDEDSCPVCEEVCVDDILYTKQELSDVDKELQLQQVGVYATLKNSVEEECFLKLNLEGSDASGLIYLKVNAGASTTDTENILLGNGSYKIKANVKE
jgi:hypothetical protein